MGYLEVCKVESQLSLVNPHNSDLRDLGFSRAGRHSRVSGPHVNEKRDGLTCHSESYPGLRRGDEGWGLGPWATTVFSSKSEEAGQSWIGVLLLGPGGDVRLPRGEFGQSTFKYPFMPQLGQGPEGGLGFSHE